MSDQSDSVEDTSERDRKTAEECIDSLDEAIQAEVESLLNEMDAEDN